MFVVMNAAAGTQPLVTLSDPAGDDFGDGTLVYPQRSDFRQGDLDLQQLQISRDAHGFWFEATLKNPVRAPVGVHATVGGDPLADSARKGFYQFNIDVYVDTDRIKGSGNSFTLPGRKVRIDADYAWERAVILTPRPEMIRNQLIGALIEQYPDRAEAEIKASVDRSLFFPTRIMVRGKSIRYFVPAGFFGGSDGGNWAATLLVTGALTSVPANFSLGQSNRKPLDDLVLGVMQPADGHPVDTFGHGGGNSGPVVDMLGATAELQVRQLAGKEALTGVTWGDGADAGRQPVMQVLPSVIPISELLQPEAAMIPRPAEQAPAQIHPGHEGSIAQRLQALQQLLDQKLIDEAEYRQQKQRILNEL